ncbi:MAG TPA: HAD hydrolase-like protein [Acidimicrobiales bacterium]|nr:HAD hydrolase-like protein [Acidimicrobiales bacterium]
MGRSIRRLLMWDVDGTLVRAGDLGAAVFDVALEAVLGLRPAVQVRMSGKTDPQIVREYLEKLEVEDDDETVHRILDGIQERLAAAAAAGDLAAGGHACPGVPDVLAELSKDDRLLSTLVTGNVVANARLKVAAWGLDAWFDMDVGAYGSDHADRNQLVPLALGRVHESYGVRLAPSDAWVIGDTPRDLECARSAGARCLLVGTGRYTATDLAALGADAVLEDLSDTTGVVEILTGDLDL